MLKSLFKRENRSVLNDPKVPLTFENLESAGFSFGGGLPTKAGANVTPEKSLTISSVFSAATLLGGTIGQLPIHIYRLKPDDRREKAQTASNKFLWQKPNAAMTKQVYWEQQVVSGLLWGASYAWKVWDGSGKVSQLWPIMPNRIKVSRVDPITLEKKFVIDGDTENELTQREIFHVPMFSLDGINGLSVVGLARESIGLAMATEEFGSRFFSQGSTLSGVIETAASLDEPSAKRIAKQWQAKHAGLANSHLPAILDNGAKWHEIGIPPEDAQFLETRRFQVADIARWFRVPPHLIGDVERSTSWGNGIAEQNLAFKVYTLGPILTRYEQALSDDIDLLPLNHYAKFNTDAFLRGDTKSRYEAHKMAREGGWLNVNEIRELEDRDPLGDVGEMYIQPLNFAPLGSKPLPTKNNGVTNNVQDSASGNTGN